MSETKQSEADKIILKKMIGELTGFPLHEPLLVHRLRGRFGDADISFILDVIIGICHECWDSDRGCYCWNDD